VLSCCCLRRLPNSEAQGRIEFRLSFTVNSRNWRGCVIGSAGCWRANAFEVGTCLERRFTEEGVAGLFIELIEGVGDLSEASVLVYSDL